MIRSLLDLVSLKLDLRKITTQVEAVKLEVDEARGTLQSLHSLHPETARTVTDASMGLLAAQRGLEAILVSLRGGTVESRP